MTSRLHKLRAMSAAEIGSRLGYRAFLTSEAVRHRRGHFVRGDRLMRALSGEVATAEPLAAILSLRERRAVKFFPGAADRAEMRRLFETTYRTELESARSHADSVMRHEFEFFGERFQYGPKIEWHADPPSGRSWPRTYHRSVLVDGGDTGYGDVKYVWELNRHQFLIDRGKACFLFDDAAAGAELLRLVADWRTDNPYGTGVSWACALEPAFRAWSWLWAYHLALRSGALNTEDHLQWLTGFYDHGRFLYRHLEYYASPYNHLAGEAAALYALGVLFPEFREAASWRRHGREVLESRLASQFHEDGGSVEQSAFYHHATLGFYILSALLGRNNGESFSPAVWSAIERGIAFSMHLRQPDGTVPRIGGADDGKPIRMQHLPFWDFRPYYAIGAVLFNRPDFKFAAGRFAEDALWLLGPEGRDRFEQLPSEAPAQTETALRRSGYFILRSDWTDRADYVCFDCGEQAAGARRDNVRSAMHGHADCLSVVVWLGGEPVLVDPGFFCYNGDPEWEVHFRKTIAHNTARVDGQDQATHVHKMDWCRTFKASFDRWHVDESGALVTGSHDGFAHASGGGVTHRRTVWRRPRGYVLVLDEVEGSGSHEIDLTYQFAPGPARLDHNRLVFRDTFELVWHSEPRAIAGLCQGGQGPHEGWIAPSLGVKVPAPRLNLHVSFRAPRIVVLAVLADLRVAAGGSRVRAVAHPQHGEVFAVEGNGLTEVVVLPQPGGSTAVRIFSGTT